MTKKYEQPYQSRHVVRNSVDPIRADEPPYIKNFPRFLHNLYRKQTPFHINLMAHIRAAQTRSNTFQERSATVTRSSSRKSPSARAPRSPSPSSNRHQQREPREQQQERDKDRDQRQQAAAAAAAPSGANFRTLGSPNQPQASKSPSMTISAVPSDFEHIFHYSETQ